MSDYKTIMEDPPEVGYLLQILLPHQGASAAPVRDDNLFVWEATIFGPEECMWEGGIFPLSMKFSEEYPSKPPKVRFTFPVYHPNVYADGSLCLDIIQVCVKPPRLTIRTNGPLSTTSTPF
jgi:ubiquitin-conjugating enzyme E2 A